MWAEWTEPLRWSPRDIREGDPTSRRPLPAGPHRGSVHDLVAPHSLFEGDLLLGQATISRSTQELDDARREADTAAWTVDEPDSVRALLLGHDIQ